MHVDLETIRELRRDGHSRSAHLRLTGSF